jgi:hypothetical protein
MKIIITLAATLTLAITLTLTACEEKKKQDGTTTTATEPAAEAATQQPATQEVVAEKPVENDGGNVKLLETITDENSKVRRFEYDKQNRIIKIVGTYDTHTITYTDNLITVDTQKFVINGNTVTTDNYTLTIDKDGYIVKKGYEYKDGNLTGVSEYFKDERVYYRGNSYDNKKSPFSNSNTPKWLIQDLFPAKEEYVSKNNVIEFSFQGPELSGGCKIGYQYDKDGFPVIETKICDGDGGGDGDDEPNPEITNYTYYGSK